MFDKIIESKKEEMLSSLKTLISFPSISIESNDPKMPFGKACNDALEYILKLGKELGFRIKNIDGYCGYIEFGEGEEIVGIIGHLDVVPADDNWTYSPFNASIKDDKLYGRGAIDDKGPVISALYAMKAVLDTTKVNKRVRLILGLNEEKDWKCIKYYKEHEELPTIGFSPDADFPCIYAEKGILTFYLIQEYNSIISENEPIKIINIDTNKNAINVVPKYCEVTLEILKSINCLKLIDNIKKYAKTFNFDISAEQIDFEHVKIISKGISSHAAHPDLGKNAISQLLIILNKIFKEYKIENSLITFFDKYIGLEYNGKTFGISSSDESGDLTLNVGDFKINNGNIEIGFNLRVPISINLDKLFELISSIANSFSKKISLNLKGKKEPLYINKDNFLVKTLCTIFNDKTKMNVNPIAIGGATYARAFDNCISFGANMPGHEDMCHKVDEYIEIDSLILSSKIYANAIYELSK